MNKDLLDDIHIQTIDYNYLFIFFTYTDNQDLKHK